MKEILQRVLKNALEAYVMYIPNLSTIEAPQGDKFIDNMQGVINAIITGGYK